MSDLSSGIRIRLDLSSIESCSNRHFRWAYLPFSDFSTIKDLKNYVRSQCLGAAKQKVRLFLEEPFWLPASENIRILQNGDLVTVKIRSDSDAEKVEQKNFQKIKRESILEQETSSATASNILAVKSKKRKKNIEPFQKSSSSKKKDDLANIGANEALTKIKKSKPGTVNVQKLFGFRTCRCLDSRCPNTSQNQTKQNLGLA